MSPSWHQHNFSVMLLEGPPSHENGGGPPGESQTIENASARLKLDFRGILRTKLRDP